MGNDGGFPLAIGLIIAAAILGALIACGIIVGMFLSAVVQGPQTCSRWSFNRMGPLSPRWWR